MARPREKDAGTRLDEWSPRLLKSRLYQRILVDVIIGSLAPGEQLDENALALRYGGGLAGIREALARLALEGLVVRRARVGTSVSPLDMVNAREAFEARCLIEVHCAGLAAVHASDAEIAAIHSTLDDGEKAVITVPVALLPEINCRDAIQGKQLVRVLPGWSVGEGIIHLVFPSRRGMLPSVRATIDFLATTLKSTISSK